MNPFGDSMNRQDKVVSIPYNTFAPQLDSLVTATGNLMYREWPQRHSTHAGSKIVVHSLLLVAANTYSTIRFIAADEPPNAARKKEFALSISPLARTLLDSLCTFVFLFGDLPKRTAWYYKAGWREVYEEHARLVQRYDGNDAWKDYLSEQAAFVQATKTEWGITAEEEKDPRLIRRWPIPSQMIQHPNLTKDRREYLQFLYDWFYKTFSQDSHLSWPGLARRSFAVIPTASANARGPQLDKFKSDAVATAVTLLLTLLSEIELEFKFDLKSRLEYVWGVIVPFYEDAEDLYDRYYRTFFRS